MSAVRPLLRRLIMKRFSLSHASMVGFPCVGLFSGMYPVYCGVEHLVVLGRIKDGEIQAEEQNVHPAEWLKDEARNFRAILLAEKTTIKLNEDFVAFAPDGSMLF